jgi:hypothetical protein
MRTPSSSLTNNTETTFTEKIICPDGKVMKCVNKPKIKICPDGKYLNPKTGRCIRDLRSPHAIRGFGGKARTTKRKSKKNRKSRNRRQRA